MECDRLSMVLLVRNWQVCPLVEYSRGGWSWTTLKLGLDGPRNWLLSVLGEESVYDLGILVLRVEEEAVHVEKTGANWWKFNGSRHN